MLRTILSAVFFLTTVVGSAQAATLTASGATGVEVNGVNYDVTFGDATCAAMYDGCDDASDFTFATMTEALAASNALRDLFNLAGNEQFTDTPSLTDGCTFVGLCRILTLTGQNAPEAGKWRFAAFRNNSSAGVSDFTYESCCATVGFTGGPDRKSVV